MKYFTSNAVTITTLRKAGYYPSQTVASRLATKIAWVIEAEKSAAMVQAISGCLHSGFPVDEGDCHNSCGNFPQETIDEFNGCRRPVLDLTPSEQTIIKDLIAWWSATEVDAEYAQKAFLAINLNAGRTLCVADRR